MAIQVAASADWAAQAGEDYEPPTPERWQRQSGALARFTRTDPAGCWLADTAEGPVGFAVAMRRGRLWGLATLFVHPEAQGRGVGRALIEQAMTYGTGADIWLVLSSRDPRAIRRYAALDLALHPSVSLAGTVDRTALPGDVAGRDGTVDDLDLVADVDTRLRQGSSRAEDVAFMLEHGAPTRLHVIDRSGHRGWLVTGQAGRPAMLGADDVATARSLLVRALVHSEPGEHVAVHFVTAEQNWAVEPCLTAGLTVTAGGPIFLSGWHRPPAAWLPSGLYF